MMVTNSAGVAEDWGSPLAMDMRNAETYVWAQKCE
jgi:hypothetical protein